MAPPRQSSTLADFRAARDPDALELVGGVLVPRAAPSMGHASAEAKLAGALHPFNRKPGASGPGGWWIALEIHVQYDNGEVYCHAAAGWRRDRLASKPTGWPITERPDWVCEIVSPHHEKRDLVTKPTTLLASRVGHYWLIDPEAAILLVHRWTDAGYVVVPRATAGDLIRAEPFAGVQIDVTELFGDSDDVD